MALPHHGLASRELARTGEPAINHKRVFRITKQNGMLLARHTGRRTGRVHDGKARIWPGAATRVIAPSKLRCSTMRKAIWAASRTAKLERMPDVPGLQAGSLDDK